MRKNSSLRVGGQVLACLTLLSSAASASAPRLDLATAVVWPARCSWDTTAESRYSEFVATIGRAAAAGRCRTLALCLNEPAINPLHEAGTAPLRFHADCADVPYILRAYFAYHHGLPFAFAQRMIGRGRDARYYRDARPQGLRAWLEVDTPRRLFQSLSGVVHSGYFRTSPEVETSDFYQVAVERGAIRPGTTYYDPNGHIVVVYEIRPSGDVLFFDGHPDGLLTHGALSEKNVLGGVRQGGGFKNFRPLFVRDGVVTQARNAEIGDFDGQAHFDRSSHVVAGQPAAFHAWVRARLALTGSSQESARRGLSLHEGG